MQKIDTNILLSASDISLFMGCRHATWLDLQEATGNLKVPPASFNDPSLEALIKKGQEFEEEYIHKLEAEGKSIVNISRADKKAALTATLRAMQDGVDIIYQARFEHEIWNGWADFLVKVNKPGKFGNWSYEVVDTKLARHTKAGSILQVCLYSQILTIIQGVQPEKMHIRTPIGEQSFRVNDYMAYFRLMQKKLMNAVLQSEESTYPDAVLHCDICKWWPICNKRRRDDDVLSFVAGMGTSQMREVKTWGIKTLRSMAELTLPIAYKPSKGNIETFTKLREQALVQLQSRVQKKCVYEILPLQEGIGFYKLPQPSEGDIFFDFEGDPFVGTSGREYLFGWIYKNEYHILWATTDAEEKAAFETFIDGIMKILEDYPDMHIYHYAPYEPSALKRLMGKYVTKENEIDRLLRANVFIDLHGITRHTIRAGIESYSLKELEKLHSFERIRDLRLVGPHKVVFESLLESGNLEAVDEETRAIVQDYNKDDCLSTQSLRGWLEKLRSELVEKGNKIGRPEIGTGEAAENITEHQQRIKPLFDKLIKDLPIEKTARNNEQQAKWLLAHMLDWYRREKKSFWWNYYRLRDLADDDLLEEKDAISGLLFTGRLEKIRKSEVHYYNFPEQDSDIKQGAQVDFKGSTIGNIHYLNLDQKVLGIIKRNNKKDIHPTHIICSDDISIKVKEEAIIRMAEWVVENGMDTDGLFRSGRDLLLMNLPRTSVAVQDMGNAQHKAVEWILMLQNSVLPIQGPPGTGKSHTAARMIISLVKAGKTVGITALSHKVITSLLQKVNHFATEEGVAVSIVQKVNEFSNNARHNWIEADDNAGVSDALQKGANVAAGTSFMWSRPEFFETVDVLFVDEAGQLSLIDTLALSHAGKNLVLLGDPQQLQQPQKGHHPEGTEVSALEHILNGKQTIESHKGVFLDKTWRLHPAICEYISELFYESRLEPMIQNANQRLEGETRYSTPGIHVETVQHMGNNNSSVEEVVMVRTIINELLENDIYYVDQHNTKRKLSPDCIKVISPYNAQVNALSAALPLIQVGTVDKFQGQEAPVVIFSMATSTPGDAPRGMEFLYSLNRLNVAVSRARAVFILVASPALFEPDCRSPHQMKLANALCRLAEKTSK